MKINVKQFQDLRAQPALLSFASSPTFALINVSEQQGELALAKNCCSREESAAAIPAWRPQPSSAKRTAYAAGG